MRPLTAGILSERRAAAPFGLAGGGAATKGANLLLRADGRAVSLGGKATVAVGAGDVLRILTPGGGGYGRAGGGGGGGGSGGGGGGGGGGGEDAADRAGAAAAVERGSVHAWRLLQESA
jgi:5-oxoprolinase (ATP-hydrolysing)